MALSPDGKLLAAGGGDGLLRVFSVEEKKLVTTLEKHTGWVLGAAFSRDGKLLATSGSDWNVWVWDVATWESTVKLREEDAVQSVSFGADGRSLALAVGGPAKQTLQIRRMDNVRSRRPVSTGVGMPLDVVWTGKANRMYVPCSDGAVRIVEAYARVRFTLTGHQDWVYCAALSPDEKKVASGSADGTVRIFDAEKGQPLTTLVQLAPQTDDWLIVTSKGHFTASSADALQWKTAGGDAPTKEVTDGLSSPETVREVLAKNNPAAVVKPAN